MRIMGLESMWFDTLRRWRPFLLVALAFVVVLGAAWPSAAQYRAGFADPPWIGGWSDGSSSQGEITVWRPSTSGSANVTVDLIWTLGIDPDDTASMLEAAFEDASVIGTAQASFSSGNQTTSVTLQTDQLTAPQNVPYFLWITVDGQVVQALDGSLQTRDLWVVFHSPGYTGPETAVTIEDSDLTINAHSATFTGEVVLQPVEAYSRWRTSYQYRLLFDSTSMAGPNDFASGIALISEPDNLPTTPDIDPNPISAPLRAPWDWPSGNLDLVVEVGRYDSSGEPIQPEDSEFSDDGNSLVVFTGCANLSAPPNLDADPQGSGFSTISWSSVSGATGYLLRVETGGQDDFVQVSGTSHSYNFTAGLTYQIGVRAFTDCSSGMRSYGPPSQMTVTAGGPPTVGFTFTVDEYVDGVGFTTHFSDTSTGIGSFTYFWEFGDGSTSSQRNPVHTYTEGGCYQVTLSVTNIYGTASSTQTVATPVVGISFDWTRAAASDAINFVGSAVGENVSKFSWRWDFGGGGSGANQGSSVSYTYNDTGVYSVTVTATHCDGTVVRVTRNVPATASTSSTVADELGVGGATFRHLIPAAARTAGAGGAKWSSDVAILNPGDLLSEVRLYPLSTEDNSASFGRRIDIDAGASLKLEDFVGVFAIDSGAGGVLVCSEHLMVITSRTFNTDPAGTFGQFIPAVPVLGGVRENEVATLIQLTQDGRAGVGGFRSNVGVLNMTGSVLRARANLFADDGSDLGVKNRNLPPFAFYQWNQIFGDVDTVNDAYAVVGPVGGAGGSIPGDNVLFTYASVVDNLTGDPVYIEPPRMLTSERPGYVPAAAKAAGVGGSFWRTDLEVHNPGPGVASFRLALLRTGLDNTGVPRSQLFTLDEGNSRRFEDVLGEQFSYEGSAAVRVEVSQGAVVATSRTYTDRVVAGKAGAGTYGQYIPCYPQIEGVRSGDAAYIPQLAEFGNSDPSAGDLSGFRTNVGFVSLSAEQMQVRTVLYDGEGREVGRKGYSLKPYEHKQYNRIFGGGAGVENGYAVVLPAPGANLGDEPVLLAYASVVDNRSADPVYIPASSLLPVADFSVLPEQPRLAEEVVFVDRSIGHPTGWQWFMGEAGSTSTDRDPVWVYDEPGDYGVVLEVSNGDGSSRVTENVSVTGCTTAIELSPRDLADGTVGTSYAETVTASGGMGPPFTIFVETGELPPGLELTNATTTSVDIAGVPDVGGDYPLTLGVEGNSGCTGSVDYSVSVACTERFDVLPAEIAHAVAGEPYTQDGSVDGGIAPYVIWAVGLPDWIVLTRDGEAGTWNLSTAGGDVPNDVGGQEFAIAVAATDARNCIGTTHYVLTVDEPSPCAITVAPNIDLPRGKVGLPYGLRQEPDTVWFRASPYVSQGEYIFGVLEDPHGLPLGLDINTRRDARSVYVSGTPTTPGNYRFRIEAFRTQHACSGESVQLSIIVDP